MPKTKKSLRIAYCTMEIGLESDIPTYAGGLGMLAADIMRSCADLKVPAACITICWQHGYMKQAIQLDGSQQYEDIAWHPRKHMKRLLKTVTVKIEGRDVTVGGWVYELFSSSESATAGESRSIKKNGSRLAPLARTGHMIPILFLDTNLEENIPEDRAITEHLYGGDGALRMKQELVLGVGGVRMLRALGYDDVGTYHMNEGHAAFLTLELLREHDYKDENVRKSCAFTTHTPVAAGHDYFDYDLAWKICGDILPWHIKDLAGQERLGMTQLAMHLSRYTCGVSKVHGEISRRMFPGEAIDSITNGIHHPTWVSPEMAKLFDAYASGWRENPSVLATRCRELPDAELWDAHMAAKRRLIEEVNKHTAMAFDTETLTIASARRVVSYKRPELLYENLERLQEVCQGKVQIIHAGNAHPADQFAQSVIQRMIERSQILKDVIRIVYLPNYNPDLAKLLVQGADVWLNTPLRLHEASGTSGMKAALNGTLNVSTLDGWWIEAYERDPESGWRIGPLAPAHDSSEHRKIDAEDIYTELQYQIIPEYEYEGHMRWIRRMKRSIGLIGYFNTHRCVKEYLERAWNN